MMTRQPGRRSATIIRWGALCVLLLLLGTARAATAREMPAPQDPTDQTACASARPVSLTTTATETGVRLTWPQDDANWFYEIHHSTTPYFTPTDSNKVAALAAPATSWTDPHAPLTSGNDYYLLRMSGCSGEWVSSNRTGSFSYQMPLAGTLFGEIRAGEATYYDADGSGNCSFPADPDDIYVAALDTDDYGPDARLCGATIRVWGPYGEVQVRVVDRCPDLGCLTGHVDMHPEAFSRIAPLPYGQVPINWQLVSPPIEGDIVYHFKDASNPWWMGVQVRNHRNPLASFEVWHNGAWLTLPRSEYNYFLSPEPLGNGPFTFRVTDIFGNQVVTAGVPLLDDGTWPGGGQFPQVK